jgi:hypothetical protein
MMSVKTFGKAFIENLYMADLIHNTPFETKEQLSTS